MWNILVVDDNFINRKFIIEILKPYAKCDIAANGSEAIEAYRLSVENDVAYDLILLDISMPEVDGIDVLKQIRVNEKLCGQMKDGGIPIIMVTAYNELKHDAYQEGCSAYILKPIQTEVLMNTIKEMLGES